MTPRSKYWDIRASDVPEDLFPSGRVRISLGDHREKYVAPRRAQLRKLRQHGEWEIIRGIADGDLSIREVTRAMRGGSDDAAIAELRERLRSAQGERMPTFAEQAEVHLESIERGEHAPATVDQRRSLLRKVAAAELPDGRTVGEQPLHQIAATDLREVIRGLSESNHSREAMRNCISAMYSEAIARDREQARIKSLPRRITVNPSRMMDRFETRPRTETATDTQVRKLFAVAQLYQRAYLRPFIHLGLRSGELRHTRLHEDLDRKTWEWKIQPRGPDDRCGCRACKADGWSPKTSNSERSFIVPDRGPGRRVRQAISLYLEAHPREPGDFIFRSKTGRVWNRKSLQRDFERLCERAEVRYGRNTPGGIVVHTLRHTAATNLIRSGVDSAVVADLLGDSVETVVRNYIHLTPADLAEGVAMGPDFGTDTTDLPTPDGADSA